MTAKRSKIILDQIRASLDGAQDNPAPVGFTGSGIPSPTPVEQTLRASEASNSSNVVNLRPLVELEQQASNGSPPVLVPSISGGNTQESKVLTQESSADLHRTAEVSGLISSYVPQRVPKSPTWQKANVTLEPEDMIILDRSDTRARSYGFRIRKGGNPSLFVRAGLRLLNDLLEKDPDTWVKRIAETIPASDA